MHSIKNLMENPENFSFDAACIIHLLDGGGKETVQKRHRFSQAWDLYTGLRVFSFYGVCKLLIAEQLIKWKECAGHTLFGRPFYLEVMKLVSTKK